MAVIPLDGTQPLLLRHVGTPQRMADLLHDVCQQQVWWWCGQVGVCVLWVKMLGRRAGAWDPTQAELRPSDLLPSSFCWSHRWMRRC